MKYFAVGVVVSCTLISSPYGNAQETQFNEAFCDELMLNTTITLLMGTFFVKECTNQIIENSGGVTSSSCVASRLAAQNSIFLVKNTRTCTNVIMQGDPVYQIQSDAMNNSLSDFVEAYDALNKIADIEENN